VAVAPLWPGECQRQACLSIVRSLGGCAAAGPITNNRNSSVIVTTIQRNLIMWFPFDTESPLTEECNNKQRTIILHRTSKECWLAEVPCPAARTGIVVDFVAQLSLFEACWTARICRTKCESANLLFSQNRTSAQPAMPRPRYRRRRHGSSWFLPAKSTCFAVSPFRTVCARISSHAECKPAKRNFVVSINPRHRWHARLSCWRDHCIGPQVATLNRFYWDHSVRRIDGFDVFTTAASMLKSHPVPKSIWALWRQLEIFGRSTNCCPWHHNSIPDMTVMQSHDLKLVTNRQYAGCDNRFSDF